MDSVLYQLKGSVAIIRLNRPEKFNSFNRKMALLLQRYLDDAGNDENVRAVYITGNGKAFSAGQDISELTGDDPISFDKILSEHFNPVIKKIRELQLPVVCGVNGVAAGAGANIALCCDIVVASANASFIQAFSKIGLIPDSGGTYFLPRLIGFQKASALMMLGEKVDAYEAERLGMIYKVLDEDGFDSSAESIASALAQMPTQGLALTKQALNNSFKNNFEQQLKTEDELQFKAGNTADYREGIAAFTEKRKPSFKGK
jgi:2-(1,2-epoxy-1,2-dihydrophenyl)acetyl-CoA isomerase